jgi:hypothetical protein
MILSTYCSYRFKIITNNLRILMEQKLQGLEKHLHRIFVAGAILGALSCFARADYNLPLYSFLYIMWDQDIVSIKSS